MSREYILQPFQAEHALQIDYNGELNEQQRLAVTAPPGPALVIAGAGSGKTRTLTYRVAFLVEQGIPPDRILLLTFTNKAAREMMRRVADLLGQEMPELWGGTFHSIGNRILRINSELAGFPKGFTILDRDDSESLIKICRGELGLPEGKEQPELLLPPNGVVADYFSLAVNTGRSVAGIIAEDNPEMLPCVPQLEQLRRLYTERKKAIGAMDFDDLLVLWLELLRQHPEVLERYQRRFQFILVDEYQDTNHLQSDIVDLMAARHRNLMVVGDDAQSIYAWRGANFTNIFEFTKRYPEAKTYRIETNYRSTPEILKVANAAISSNARQLPKELAPARKSGAKPGEVACYDSTVQAEFVAQRVLQLAEEGSSLREMAVLYRSHFHALELQRTLTARRIPFTITSGVRYLEQAHIKDVAAWLKFVVNPLDELAFKRIVLLLPGIGPKAAEKLWKLILPALGGKAAKPEAETDAANATGPPQPIARALQSVSSSVPKKTAVLWAQVVATVAQLEVPPARQSPARMIRIVVEAFYEDYMKMAFDNPAARLDDLKELSIFADRRNSPEEFLDELALLTNVEAEDQQRQDKDGDLLRLSTIHQAKGLEFDIVFVIMLAEGLFPIGRARTPDAIEEERRLMYVAITRARNELYLCYPLIRASYGGMGDIRQVRSRFLTEIPEDLKEVWNLKSWHTYS